MKLSLIGFVLFLFAALVVSCKTTRKVERSEYELHIKHTSDSTSAISKHASADTLTYTYAHNERETEYIYLHDSIVMRDTIVITKDAEGNTIDTRKSSSVERYKDSERFLEKMREAAERLSNTHTSVDTLAHTHYATHAQEDKKEDKEKTKVTKSTSRVSWYIVTLVISAVLTYIFLRLYVRRKK